MSMNFILTAIAIGLPIYAAFIDWHALRLPHVMTFPAAMAAICSVGFYGDGWPTAVAGALLGFGIIKGAQLFCRWRHKQECLGSGDAFLMLSLGALLGPVLIPWGIVCATLLAALAAHVLKKSRLPFGPFLVGGCLGIWAARNLGLSI